MAFSCNGSTDRIDYANILDSNTTAHTWSLWIYPVSIAANQYLILVHNSVDNATRTLFYTSASGSGRLNLTIQTNSTNMSRVAGNSSIVVNTWQHVLVTWDGSLTAANVHIYVNGSEVSYAATNDGTGTIQNAEGSWSLAGRIFDDTRNFNGRIANAGFWNRELAAGEIAALAKGYSPFLIRRGLKWAPDLIRYQRDRISGKTGTLDGTTVIEHPRTRFVGQQLSVTYPSPVAAGTILPQMMQQYYGVYG